MSRRSLLGLGLTWALTGGMVHARDAPMVRLEVASDGDNLTFVPEHLTCISGATVRLRFRHLGKIIDEPHDWVLLKAGSQRAFLADADRETDAGQKILADDKHLVLAATALCARGQSTAVTFIAPSPGDYPFVCSVPGHGETMRGILTVLIPIQ